MKLLAIDGNSIINRAFYGIKLLSTKSGQFTNGIQGFMNIMTKLRAQIKPDAVAVAFDLRAPTFRHKMYDGYKAGRKGMPPELASQMPILKELLKHLGIKIVEIEGYEADDILGTLSKACVGDDFCFIATGDRDSLQLVGDNTKVCLATTRETIIYDTDKIMEEYGVTPSGLIEIKALQGDSSDNIPGVAGIGKKTAGDLIQQFKTIDYIYENLDEIEIKNSVREKLRADKEKAYLSHKLGTIDRDIPIDTSLESYIVSEPDSEAFRILAELEMFSMIEKLGIERTSEDVTDEVKESVEIKENVNLKDLENKQIFIIPDTDCGYIAWDNFVAKIDEDLTEEILSSELEKVTADIKAIYEKYPDLEIGNVIFDTALAGYILNPSANSYEISRLAQEYAINIPECDDEYIRIVSLAKSYEILSKKIEENNQTELLKEIEMPLAQVLADMEETGFLVDRFGIEEFSEDLDTKIKSLTQEIYNQVGYEFNINSPKQLGEALFEKLGLPAKKKTKSGYSTNAEVLEALVEEHPVIEKILSYRTLAKLKSTYCDGLLKVITPDGRIHSTLNQTETRTGRISSTEPNLQNIPVRSEIGREMRKFFIAKPGYVLVDADYSQIELRVLADIADDENMINAFNNGDDIHSITASQVFNMPLELVTPLMRSRAKAVNFGIVYGIGAFSLGKDIGVSRAEADKYIKGYLTHYSGVDKYMKDVVEKAKDDGFVSTVFNRRRYLPELTASNGMLRSFGERVARNMPIQGTAADIIKIAMVKVWKRLKDENLDAQLIMQVHDELIVEASEDIAQTVKQIVKEEMENACKMKVSLLADVSMGKSWYDAKE
ncbi:MAG: DNA polymerase I [Clostridia bacterium]|nr:DNA polymerase I [Clostridia bacterium]